MNKKQRRSPVKDHLQEFEQPTKLKRHSRRPANAKPGRKCYLVQYTWGERVQRNSKWCTWKAYATEKQRDAAYRTLAGRGTIIRASLHFRRANIVNGEPVAV